MSREDVKRFKDEIDKNEVFKKEVMKLNPSSLKDWISFAAKKGFTVTVDELKELQQVEDNGVKLLSEDELAQVSAGLQPTVGANNRYYCRQCHRQVQSEMRERSPGKYIFIFVCKNCGWEGHDPMIEFL